MITWFLYDFLLYPKCIKFVSWPRLKLKTCFAQQTANKIHVTLELSQTKPDFNFKKSKYCSGTRSWRQQSQGPGAMSLMIIKWQADNDNAYNKVRVSHSNNDLNISLIMLNNPECVNPLQVRMASLSSFLVTHWIDSPQNILSPEVLQTWPRVQRTTCLCAWPGFV